MQRIGSLLWPSLQCIQVYGSSTNVGKTIVSTVLCGALQKRKNLRTHFLKPVSTGSPDDADKSHVAKFFSGVRTKSIFDFSQPVSPHLAVRRDNKSLSDAEVRLAVRDELASYAALDGYGTAVVETAGGVLSPSPSGSTQADLYRPFRLPVLLVGDRRLGGIATSISAFESLHIRGYDVDAIVLFEDSTYGNLEYLQKYFLGKGVPVVGIPQPPPRSDNEKEDSEKLAEYYKVTGASESISELLHHLESKHNGRVLELESMPDQATKSIWWPFQQHQLQSSKDIMAIESAYGDYFDALNPETSSMSKESDTQRESILQPALDGSASWWTQGLGHGNPELALSAAYAAGRYGHVMFGNAIHKPALELAHNILRMHKNPRLAKVFYSDNGSTGVEVAVKMALKASCQRYSWDHEEDDVVVLGLTGSYHGDTMGAMDCSEPSTYNKTVAWYQPRGIWFDFPQVKLRDGQWTVEMPVEMSGSIQNQRFSSLGEIFKLRPRSDLLDMYKEYIANRLQQLQAEGVKIGALILEPVLLGAGGMLMPDPLFQHALVQTVRQHPELISPNTPAMVAEDTKSWSGVPVVFDEVFAGVYRLGRFNTSSFLNVHPDIIINAKLLTGGLVPLSTTTASQEIFDAFLSDSKADALLHGHSYTAHALGCTVANKSLATLQQMEKDGVWNPFKQSWIVSPQTRGPSVRDNVEEAKQLLVWSMWSTDFVSRLSKLDSVDHVVTLGSVLAISLKDDAGSGYESNAAVGLHKTLLRADGSGWNIHSRVLGNVLYIMASQISSLEKIRAVEARLLDALR